MKTSGAAERPPQVPERTKGQPRKPAEAPRGDAVSPPQPPREGAFELELDAYDMPCTD